MCTNFIVSHYYYYYYYSLPLYISQSTNYTPSPRVPTRCICALLVSPIPTCVRLTRVVFTPVDKSCNVNQQNALFKISALFQFFLSSICFEHIMFIIRTTTLYVQPCMLCFHTFMQAVYQFERYCMLYFNSAVGLTPGGNSTQYTLTQKQYTEQHNET